MLRLCDYYPNRIVSTGSHYFYIVDTFLEQDSNYRGENDGDFYIRFSDNVSNRVMSLREFIETNDEIITDIFCDYSI